MRFLVALLVLFALTGCTSVKYNGSPTDYKDVSYPEVGTQATAYVGDTLLQKGIIAEGSILFVKKTIEGVLYDIPAKKYSQIGYDNKQDFFSGVGVIKGVLSDPVQALSLNREEGSQLCVITIFGGSACYDGEYETGTQILEFSNSFQQTLIYSGRIGNKINISYREFSNNSARPAFNNDVEYDLNTSKRIGYKGALIDVIEADNSKIVYKVVKNFPDSKNP